MDVISDHIDRSIVMALARDGRISGTELSKALPIDGAAVRLRLRRLLQSTVRVRALVHPARVGFPVQAYLGIRAQPTSVESVSQQLAAHVSTNYVSRLAGEFDVGVGAFFKSLKDLQVFSQEYVGSIQGVTDMDARVFLETRETFFNLSPKLLLEIADPPPGLDATDMRLISCLIEDGRLTARELAHRLSTNEPATQRRLRRLIDDGVIAIRGLAKMQTLGFPVSANIGLCVDPARIRDAARTLGKHNRIILVATCTGRFNLMAIGMFVSVDELDTTLTDFVYPIGGIKESSVAIGLGSGRIKETWIVPRAFASDTAQHVEPVYGQGERTSVPAA